MNTTSSKKSSSSRRSMQRPEGITHVEDEDQPMASSSDSSNIHGLLSSFRKELNIPNNSESNNVPKTTTPLNTTRTTLKDAINSARKSSSMKQQRKKNNEHSNVMSIPYNSMVLLSTNTMSVANTINTSTNTSEATLSGRKLSLANEHLIIIPSSSSPSYSSHTPNNYTTCSNSVLRYNDTILLFNVYNEKALGVKNDKVDFWRSVEGQAEQWKVIPLYQQQEGHDYNDDSDYNNGIVESGAKLLLKNELNGQFLSFLPSTTFHTTNNETGPTLGLKGLIWNDEPNDDINIGDDNDDGDKELRPTTQQKTVQYTKHQVFNIVKINTPPCPTWIHSRPYLNATYLSYPNRHVVAENDSLFSSSFTKRNRIITNKSNDVPLWKLDKSTQDSMLVEELLDALIGLEGQNIIISNHDDNEKQAFILADRFKFDPNVRYIVEKMLPTASQFIQVNTFISKRLVEYNYGIVSHALCGAMDILVKEYMDFIEKMHGLYRRDSSPSITLSALYGELQHSIRTISIIDHIVQEVRYCKGGALLNKMQNLLQMEFLGDDRAKSIFCYLFEQSAVPYMEMLSGWVEDGSLYDPYEEFMIEEKRRDIIPLASAGVDAMDEDSLSWKNWYVLRDEHVLNILKSHEIGFNEIAGLAQKILTTGKYWNAISLCQHRDKRAVQLVTRSPRGVESNRIKAPSLTYGMVAVDLAKYIDHEYSMASRTLFNIVMRDYQTIDVLAFMKRYFLLDQGDFFVHFLDMAEDELLKEITDVSKGRVQNWMTLSIQMSGGAGTGESDPARLIFDFITSLKGEFAEQSLINELDGLHAYDGGIKTHEPKTPSRHMYGGANKGLTGVEAFMLDFTTMPFPLSLILSRSTVRNYQLMFRHLFFAKHVERRLVGTWLDHQAIKEYTSLRQDLGKTYCLRQRMLHFMQNFVYYMMFEVIEPNFLEMESLILGRATKGDEMFRRLTQKDSVNSQTVDDILRTHNDFVQKTLKECLLTNRDLIRTLTKLMTTCLLFTDQMKLFMEATKIDEEQNSIAAEARQKRTRHMYETAGILTDKKEKRIREALMAMNQQRKARKQRQIEMLRRELKTDQYQTMISKFEQVFNSNLSEFMSQLMTDSEGRYHTHLQNLCTRLDYNGYVTRTMGSRRKRRN